MKATRQRTSPALRQVAATLISYFFFFITE
jgi:hypothetical protein